MPALTLAHGVRIWATPQVTVLKDVNFEAEAGQSGDWAFGFLEEYIFDDCGRHSNAHSR